MKKEEQSLRSTNTIFIILIWLVILLVLYLSSLSNYLLFHSLSELFSITVAFGIFIIFWNSRRFVDNSFFLFLGIAFLFVGGLDLIHTLAYKGMMVFPDYDSNLPTQLWIVARYVESISIVVGLLLFKKKLKSKFVFLAFALVFSLLLTSIFYWNIFPKCFVEGTGLTPFKKISEYIISLVLLSSIVLLYRRRSAFDPGVFRLLIVSIIVTILSELSFTFYINVYGISNLIGHIFKILSFYLIYRALIHVCLTKPYNLLFRNLKQKEEILEEAQRELENKVEERTKDLIKTNKELHGEINERRKVEETLQKTLDKLKNTQAQLIQAEKMSALGTLSAGIAHELNNPLMGILNYNQYVLKKLHPDNNLNNVIKDSERATKNCIQIVNNLLTFSRSDASGHEAYKEINFTEMLDRVLGLLSYRIEKEGISVIKDIDDGFSKINANETELQQVMLNLIINAIDAVEKSERKDIRISLRSKNDHTLITVEDNGCGISPENLINIFDPFFTTKPIGKGTGLGLSISYGIIKNHKGVISCESNINQGTCFTILLPVNNTQ